MNRIICALAGAVLLGFAFSAPAEARPDSTETYSVRDYNPVTRSTKARVSKSGTAKKFVRAKAGKRSVAAKKRYRAASTRSGRRYANVKRGRSTASYSGGGASRGCLTSAARGLLSRIESNFGPVQLVSTCRPGAVIAGSGKPSRHRHGNAIDFNAGGRKGAIVSWLIANHHSGGTMTYRGMGHIHVDIGPRFVRLGAGGRSG